MKPARTPHFPKKTLRDVPLDQQTVLVRVDYNVPLDENGKIDDDYRIVSSLPTIRALIKRHCRVVLCAHLGRPDGKVSSRESLEPIAKHLSGLLSQTVHFVSDCVGDKVHQAVKRLERGDILLMENLRFHAGEEANDPLFAEALAKSSGANYFVQDGFGVVHRAHASTDAVTRFLPSVAGLLLEKEHTMITGAMSHPERPLTAIMGGAKISDKIGLIERFVKVADQIVIGGAMANTFLKYHGYPIGVSIHEDGLNDVMDRIYLAVKKKGVDPNTFLLLPRDVAVAPSADADERRVIVSREDVGENEMILDIGTDSIHAATEAIKNSHTVIWNGTVGYAEQSQFAHGSAQIALALAQHNETVTSVVGGGDTADFVLHWDTAQKGASFDHVSTGGGASLELMAGLTLPGIAALMDA